MKKIIFLSLLIVFNLFINEVHSLEVYEKTDVQADVKADKCVTFTSSTTLSAAFRTIEILSQKETGKKIINLSKLNPVINFPVNQIYWKDALFLIVKLFDLELEELPGAFKISDPEIDEKAKGIKGLEDQIELDTQQIKISATFFQTTKDKSKGIGIDWSTVLNGNVKTRVDFKGSPGVANDIITASASTSLDNGNVTIDINTLVKILESHEVGNIIARPVVSVLSGKTGFVQVGSDFSIKTLDDAGNIADKFYSTGLILEVKPRIVEKDEIKAIHLQARVENSAIVPGQERTTIGKSQSETDVLIYNGETTVMAGLYSTDVTTVRNGVPILKDLPWWFLGIRYLTGVNKQIMAEKEMIVILKAEIVDPVKERMENITPLKEQLGKDKIQRQENIDVLKTISFDN